MKLLHRVFDFYVNSSIHVALAVLALLFITIVEFDLVVSYSLCGFVFFSTISAYNFVKYAKIAGLHHRSLTQTLKAIQIFSAICLVAAIYFGLKQAFETLVVTFLFGLLTLLYAVPFRHKRNLRSVSGLKIFIVALVWAGVTVVLPLIASENGFKSTQVIVFVQRVLFIIVLTLPFEIRDLPYDTATLRTIPQKMGILKAKKVGYLLLLCCFMLEFLKGENTHFAFILSMLFVHVLTGLSLLYAEKRQARYYASFWVESLPVVWLGILLLSIHFFA
jgi:hypothetical protein